MKWVKRSAFLEGKSWNPINSHPIEQVFFNGVGPWAVNPLLAKSIYLEGREANIWSVLLFQIFSEKLHKGKVTHAEFNPRCDWLLATASVDRTVKLWDLRNMKDRKSFLYEMPHERPVNSGCILREKDVCMAPYCSPAMLGWGWEGL